MGVDESHLMINYLSIYDSHLMAFNGSWWLDIEFYCIWILYLKLLFKKNLDDRLIWNQTKFVVFRWNWRLVGIGTWGEV